MIVVDHVIDKNNMFFWIVLWIRFHKLNQLLFEFDHKIVSIVWIQHKHLRVLGSNFDFVWFKFQIFNQLSQSRLNIPRELCGYRFSILHFYQVLLS